MVKYELPPTLTTIDVDVSFDHPAECRVVALNSGSASSLITPGVTRFMAEHVEQLAATVGLLDELDPEPAPTDPSLTESCRVARTATIRRCMT